MLEFDFLRPLEGMVVEILLPGPFLPRFALCIQVNVYVYMCVCARARLAPVYIYVRVTVCVYMCVCVSLGVAFLCAPRLCREDRLTD